MLTLFFLFLFFVNSEEPRVTKWESQSLARHLLKYSWPGESTPHWWELESGWCSVGGGGRSNCQLAFVLELVPLPFCSFCSFCLWHEWAKFLIFVDCFFGSDCGRCRGMLMKWAWPARGATDLFAFWFRFVESLSMNNCLIVLLMSWKQSVSNEEIKTFCLGTFI